MKKPHIFPGFLLICFLFRIEVSAQELIVNWTKFIGCGDTYSSVNDIISTDDGGFIFTGATNCNNSGDFTSNSLGAEDLIVGKIDKAGSIIWLKRYGGTKDDNGIRIRKTKDGQFAIFGETESSGDDITGFKGTRDLWLLKIDANGNKIWSKVYGSWSAEVALSIDTTADGGFVLLGASNGYGDDVPSHYGTSPFVYDWLVLKLDNQGNKEWAKSLGGSDDENRTGQILSIDTFYYLISSSFSKDHECADTNWHPGVQTLTDAHIIKFDRSGNIVERKVYGGTNYEEVFYAMYDMRDTSIMVCASSGSNDYYASGSSNGFDDFWVMKLGLDGTFQWGKKYGGAKNEHFDHIVPGPSGGYMIYGYTESGIYMGPPSAGIDSWLFAVDKNGDIQQNKVIGGNKQELSYNIAPFQNGYILFGGTNSPSFGEGLNSSRWPGETQQMHFTKVEYFPVSIPDVTSIGKLQIYPNPASHTFKIELPNRQGTLKVYDDTGRAFYSEQIKKTSTITLDTENWPGGVYLVVFDTGEGKAYDARLEKR